MDNSQKPHLTNFLLYLGVIVVIVAGLAFLFSKNSTTTPTQPLQTTNETSLMNKKQYASPPELTIDKSKQYTAIMTTSAGEIELNLFANETPQTVNNFVFLSKEGFYNETIFHRVVKDFMIQGGDPDGNGRGGPGYSFADENVTRDYKRGIIAMANRGPDTNGSQFFIVHKDTPLPKNYVIFGEVTKGIEVVDKIANSATVDNGQGEVSKPSVPTVVEKIDIVEK